MRKIKVILVGFLLLGASCEKHPLAGYPPFATAIPDPKEEEASSDRIKFFGKDSEWFWAMLQAVAIPITLLFIRRQVVLQRQASGLEAFRSIKKDWVSQSMLRAQEECCSTFVNPSPATKPSLNEEKIASFYELLGLYVRLGTLDKELCWNVFSYDIEHYWLILKPRLAPMMAADKTLFKDFEDLYKWTVSFSKQQGFATTRTQEELTSFCQRLLDDRRKAQNSGMAVPSGTPAAPNA